MKPTGLPSPTPVTCSAWQAESGPTGAGIVLPRPHSGPWTRRGVGEASILTSFALVLIEKLSQLLFLLPHLQLGHRRVH